MNENLLHYVWQYKLFSNEPLKSTTGEKIEIIDCGQKNEDAGPDFFNAKIKIGDTLWAGNVEIHRLSSDWYRHGHQNDERYNSVILHVVEKADRCVKRSNDDDIPQMEIVFPDKWEERYKTLLSSEEWIRCERLWNGLSPEFLRLLISKLLNQRFIRKSEAILTHLARNNNDWEDTFYIFLARNFGMNTNALPFEMLAKSLPHACLGKHKNSLFQIEALLFGQAGLLDNVYDDYPKKLQQEYLFLSRKFSLSPIDASLWKFAKMRPQNSPHIRIAQFAALIHRSSRLFSQIVETKGIAALRDFFRCTPSVYWETHYSFGKPSAEKGKAIGEKSIDILLINTVIPFLFAFSIKRDLPEMQEIAYDLLEEIAPEENSITEKWKEIGIDIRSAYDSQALLELKKQYCNEKKCLQCGIGHRLLSSL